MKLKDLIKTTEGAVVLLGLFLTVTDGKFWAIATAIAYILINVPSLVKKIKETYLKIIKNGKK
jgi:hypothetical protein|tara:strand:- start:2249 stop:2437 length:189 start_codon:yes stop_codon:yes gene_type:complete